MVIESIIPLRRILRHPVYMAATSFLITVACIAIGYFIFPAYAGVVIPLLVSVAIAPLIYRLYSIEEDIERAEAEEKIHVKFFQRHGETITLFSMFFIGSTLAFFLATIFLPQALLEVIFAQQLGEITAIRSLSTGAALSGGFLELIFFNNIRVMLFAFALSFLIGTGAIFILSWNASILAIFLANFIRQGLIGDFFMYSAGIFPHAVLEIMAYFLAGIAGGILSIGVIKEKIGGKEFNLVFKDSMILMVLAVVLVGVGAVVEVFL